MSCYREFLHPDLKDWFVFYSIVFLYIKLNKGEIIMNINTNTTSYDIDDFIFANEEAYVSER